MPTRLYNCCAAASLIALIFLGLGWELWWAPLRPGGSWLVLKILPLLAPLFGVLRGRRYTHQWLSLLSLAYVTEGVVRAASDGGLSARLAVAEIILAALLFTSTVLYVRASGKVSLQNTADPDPKP
jgi:uncharacterized membrane protein